MKVVWRGVIDEALETDFGGRHFEANVPQDVLSPEESHKKANKFRNALGRFSVNNRDMRHCDGWVIEESVQEVNPDGRHVLVTKQRWLSIAEAAIAHPCFDVEGEEPKVMKKRPKPDKYPNASAEGGENIWIGDNG
jgi:hypothetical protein